jgi:hypothetical protein
MSDQDKQIIPVGVVAMQATAIFDDAEITAVKAEDGFYMRLSPIFAGIWSSIRRASWR